MERQDVLAKIRQTVGDNSEEHRVQAPTVFCIEDGELLPEARFTQINYPHDDHVHDRAFIFDRGTKWDFTPEGELRHYSAGAILWRQEEDGPRYCLFRRRLHPIACYTLPAGHIEMGEEPQVAALREVYEETGLAVVESQLWYMEDVVEECRRGVDLHHWHLYVCQAVGEPRTSDEADIIGWYRREEILHDLMLTKATGHFYGKYFGEPAQHVRQR